MADVRDARRDAREGRREGREPSYGARIAEGGGYRMATEDLWLRGPRETAPQRDWLSFAVCDEVYAVEIERIREIIKVRPVTEVPHAPPFVVGVIAVRGVVLPVLDLRQRLRLPTNGLGRTARFLIVKREEELFGLLVDEVRQVVRLADNEIEPPPPMLAGGEAEFIGGIGRAKGQMLILLNLDNVLKFEVRRRVRGVSTSGEERRR